MGGALTPGSLLNFWFSIRYLPHNASKAFFLTGLQMRKSLGRKIGLMSEDDPPLPVAGKLLLDRTFPAISEAKGRTLEEGLCVLADAGLLVPGGDDVPRLCMDEALVNAVMHGCKNDPTKKIRLRLWSLPPLAGVPAEEHAAPPLASWAALVEDEGSGFQEEDLPDPEAQENLLVESGRGILLIRHFMDEVRWWRGGASLWMRRNRRELPA
jgi:serine/threonine-protein kinase RsbW